VGPGCGQGAPIDAPGPGYSLDGATVTPDQGSSTEDVASVPDGSADVNSSNDVVVPEDVVSRDIGTDAPAAFDREAIKALMSKVARYELSQLGTNPDNGWVNAAFYAGLMATFRTTGDAAFRSAAISWGQSRNWSLGPAKSGDTTWADNQCCTQTYLELYLLDPVNTYITKTRSAFDAMMVNPDAGRAVWWWCDALFMAPPALARLGAATKNPAYFSFMNTMFWDAKAFLYSDANNLFWRDAKYKSGNTFWSRGNGWVVAGIARILEYLPANDPKRAEYVSLLTTVLNAVARLQGADGMWRSNLLNPAQFPNPESSGTAFFTYAMAWGLEQQILPSATFLPVVRKAWNGLVGAVNAEGRVGWCQLVGEQPAAATQDSTIPYCAGAFLLAGSELVKL